MEGIIQSAVYPPVEQRSFGPTLAAFADFDPAATNMMYFKETSKELAVIPMIESTEGLENAEIISVLGVTAVFIGPVDLRLSMGLAGGDGTEEVFLQALQKVLKIAKRLGKPIGTFASDGEVCRKRTDEGFDFIMVRFQFKFSSIVSYKILGPGRSCFIDCGGQKLAWLIARRV